MVHAAKVGLGLIVLVCLGCRTAAPPALVIRISQDTVVMKHGLSKPCFPTAVCFFVTGVQINASDEPVYREWCDTAVQREINGIWTTVYAELCVGVGGTSPMAPHASTPLTYSVLQGFTDPGHGPAFDPRIIGGRYRLTILYFTEPEPINPLERARSASALSNSFVVLDSGPSISASESLAVDRQPIERAAAHYAIELMRRQFELFYHHPPNVVFDPAVFTDSVAFPWSSEDSSVLRTGWENSQIWYGRPRDIAILNSCITSRSSPPCNLQGIDYFLRLGLPHVMGDSARILVLRYERTLSSKRTKLGRIETELTLTRRPSGWAVVADRVR
jgi:hypothetical protein